MEYTDLELNKMIGELEGEVLVIYNESNLLHENDQGHMYENNMTMDWYNPIKDWRILGPLMVKYKVCLCRENNSVYIINPNAKSYDYNPMLAEVEFESESEIPRAIIMCILISENII